MGLWTVTLLVFVLNLPFGYWRASVKRLSTRWFLALLLPVPSVIALVIFSGQRWKLISLPALAGAFFLGQFVGGKVRNIIQGRGPGRSHG
jgi:phosphoglycerol transferase MdoB-like AlkP superfamily enzyme